MKGSYLSLVSWRRRIVDRTMQPAGSDRWGGKLSGPALSLPRNDLPQEIEQPGEALAGDVQALPELAVGRGAAGLPVLLSVLPPEVVPERPELAPGARIRLQALDGVRDAARHLLEALPGDAVAAFLLVEERRPAPPCVSLQGGQEVFETEGLDAQPRQLQEELPQPPGDRGQLAGLRRDQARHQLVVPKEHDPLPVGRRGQGLGVGTETQEGVVADLPVAGEDVEVSGGDRLLDRGLQQLEDPEPERIVLPLPLMQEVPDVEQDEAVDLGLLLEMPLEALQPVDEDERVAVGHQLSQGALRAGGARARRRLGIPAFPSANPQ